MKRKENTYVFSVIFLYSHQDRQIRGEGFNGLKFHEVVEGNLIQLKDRIGEILNAKIFIHPVDFMGMQRVERDEYPVAAVCEMILNALIRRNYMGHLLRFVYMTIISTFIRPRTILKVLEALGMKANFNVELNHKKLAY